MSKATSRRGVSLRALQDLDADEVPAFDARPQELRELTIVSSETLETISSVFLALNWQMIKHVFALFLKLNEPLMLHGKGLRVHFWRLDGH